MKTLKYLLLLTIASGAMTTDGATFPVTSTADSGAGTLRAAITNANRAGAGTHIISFNLGSPFTITASSALPAITNSVFVDGATQAGYTGAPIVRLYGTAASANYGLQFQGIGGGAQGLLVAGFTNGPGIMLGGLSNRMVGCHCVSNYYGASCDFDACAATFGGLVTSNRNILSANSLSGILLAGSNHVVQGNYLGPAVDGLHSLGAQVRGVSLQAPRCTVGGSAAGARNIISGNSSVGIYVTSANNSEISGNFIGLDITGTNALSNGGNGITLVQSYSNQIGGASAGHINYISGNYDDGIYLQDNANTYCTVQNNIIGLGTNGLPVGNSYTATNTPDLFEAGIELRGGGNIIALNLISGNNGNGIFIVGTNSVGNVIGANLIGVDSTGTQARRNRGYGIYMLDRVTGVLITGGLFRNIISGNEQLGIRLSAGCSSNTINANYIGTDISGANSISNRQGGITIEDSTNTFITGNLISGNSFDGISIANNQCVDTTIDGNTIGMNAGRTGALRNTGSGIRIYGGNGYKIGSGGRNYVGGNGQQGIYMSGGVSNVLLQGNYIGVGSNGTTAIANGLGVIFFNAAGSDIALSNNVISGNNAYGVEVSGGTLTNLSFGGNIIGMSASGLTSVSNNGAGIALFSASNARIGGNASAQRNVVSGNAGPGIHLENSGANGSIVIAGNYIGLHAGGSDGPGNGNEGIYAVNTPNVQVGGTDQTWRNYICKNSASGIFSSSSGSQWWIANNYIGVEVSGLTARGNLGGGIYFNLGSSSDVIENNYVAGNGGSGIYITDSAPGVVVRANWIGLGEALSIPMPNASGGMFISDSSGVLVGGYSTNDANRIAYNTGKGISVVESFPGMAVSNLLLGNLIYSNTVLAIDLGDNGATANDSAPDSDVGANGFQNFPVVLFASLSATNVSGRMISGGGTYRLEFFALPPSGGATFVGTTDATLPASGTGTFSCIFNTAVPGGSKIVASATGSSGTSEYSTPVTVAVAVDTDSDGMPDWWEQANGLDESTPNTPTDDADSDGVPDIGEWIADTQANNPSSFLEITALTPGTLSTAFLPSSGGRLYRLEAATSPTATVWQVVQDNVPGTGAILGINDPAPTAVRTYRAWAKLP